VGTIQINSLSGFIGLHRTARFTKQASVKSNTPSSLQAATPSADFNYKSPGHRNQPQTSDIKELRITLRITRVVYLQSVSIKAHTIVNRVSIVAQAPQTNQEA
jgi:hypothetical protein